MSPAASIAIPTEPWLCRLGFHRYEFRTFVVTDDSQHVAVTSFVCRRFGCPAHGVIDQQPIRTPRPITNAEAEAIWSRVTPPSSSLPHLRWAGDTEKRFPR